MRLVTKSIRHTTLATMLFGVVTVAQSAEPSDLFVIRNTTKSPEMVITGLKNYSDSHNWLFVGATKVKNDQVTLVKVCIPEVGKQIWPQGLYLSALLPCGNIGIYTNKSGKTEVSMLKAEYMHVLVPTPEMAKASAMAEPLLSDMLLTAIK